MSVCLYNRLCRCLFVFRTRYENLWGSEAECSRYLRLQSIRSSNQLDLNIYPVFNLREKLAGTSIDELELTRGEWINFCSTLDYVTLKKDVSWLLGLIT